MQPRRLRAVRLTAVIYSPPSTGREARELPRFRFRFAVAPAAKRQRFLRRRRRRRHYLAYGLHGILQIPETQVGNMTTFYVSKLRKKYYKNHVNC